MKFPTTLIIAYFSAIFSHLLEKDTCLSVKFWQTTKPLFYLTFLLSEWHYSLCFLKQSLQYRINLYLLNQNQSIHFHLR